MPGKEEGFWKGAGLMSVATLNNLKKWNMLDQQYG